MLFRGTFSVSYTDVELTEEQSEAVEEVAEQTITPKPLYAIGGSRQNRYCMVLIIRKL